MRFTVILAHLRIYKAFKEYESVIWNDELNNSFDSL